MTAITNVGMVGVGTMGMPMSANLLERGYAVHGYRRGPLDEFAAIGGRPTASPAELAERSDVVVVILPDEGALDDVALSDHGLVAGARPGLIVIELSTLRVDRKRAVRDALADVGVQMLDAPISGMPGMVTARAASIFASGQADLVEQHREVMESITDNVKYVGDFGHGTAIKLIANLLVGVHTLAAAEALALAHHAGLDLMTVIDVLKGGVASSTLLEMRGPMMAAGSYTPAPGPVNTLLEGIGQIREFAAQVDSPTPLFALAAEAYERARDDGRGHEDIAMVFTHFVDRIVSSSSAHA